MPALALYSAGFSTGSKLMKSAVKIPTDRKFGYTFAVVFALFGAWLFWHANRTGLAFIGGGAVFAALAATAPKILHPLNVAWMYLGFVLNKIVSPIVLGAIYALIIVPVGVFFRLRGRDPLQRRLEPDAKTYWVDRTPPGPTHDNFPRQF